MCIRTIHGSKTQVFGFFFFVVFFLEALYNDKRLTKF